MFTGFFAATLGWFDMVIKGQNYSMESLNPYYPEGMLNLTPSLSFSLAEIIQSLQN